MPSNSEQNAAEELELELERDMTVAAEVHSDSTSDSDPLLPPEHPHRVPPRPNPLPKLQLAVVYFIKLIIPIAATQNLPYINVFVADLAKAAGAKTGYYSGLVVSSTFSKTLCHGLNKSSGKCKICRALTDHLLLGAPFWYVVHLGIRLFAQLTNCTRSTWAETDSHSWHRADRFLHAAIWAIADIPNSTLDHLLESVLAAYWRAPAAHAYCPVGIFSGTTGAIHSIVGELVDSTNEAIAFPLYDIVSAVGYAVG